MYNSVLNFSSITYLDDIRIALTIGKSLNNFIDKNIDLSFPKICKPIGQPGRRFKGTQTLPFKIQKVKT